MTKRTLTELELKKKLNTPGFHLVGNLPEGGSLYLKIEKSKTSGEMLRRWVLRYYLNGKRYMKGLKTYKERPLLSAIRKAASAYMQGLENGVDVRKQAPDIPVTAAPTVKTLYLKWLAWIMHEAEGAMPSRPLNFESAAFLHTRKAPIKMSTIKNINRCFFD